ncbi:hypothetical protein [Actinoallomurus sp. NPDC050550]|uniref:hypothetical protein n=1 Tax=Actinoallomurus sp. NPDC050550 TaxID=3154937 RepID=UPI003410BCDD
MRTVDRDDVAASYGHAVVERGPFGGLQLGGAEEAGDLAGHVEGDRQFQGGDVLSVGGGVLGHECLFLNPVSAGQKAERW